MKIKVLYKRNIKDVGKIASQVAHAVWGLGLEPNKEADIIVLKASNKVFDIAVEQHPNCYVQIDKGLTIVKKGTATAVAWIENL